MINTMLGTKKNMTSSYDARGRRVGATMVELGPNFITQINSHSIQIGFSSKKSVKKPQQGLFKKAQVPENLRWLREVRVKGVRDGSPAGTEDVQVGQEIKVNQIFKTGDAVKVTGTSKGKGFQGGVKRYNFAGGPKTHGQSDRHRAPGSIGAGTTPGRVWKGKKMAGHMGMATVSYTGLEVLAIDGVNNLVTIKGGIPGPIGGLVRVEKQGVIKGYTPPPEEKPDEEEEGSENQQASGLAESENKGEEENAS